MVNLSCDTLGSETLIGTLELKKNALNSYEYIKCSNLHNFLFMTWTQLLTFLMSGYGVLLYMQL